MYGITDNKRKLKEARERLNVLYSKIPDTKGCMQNNRPESEGGCGAWCCKTQTPQVLYTEFLNTWKSITKDWDDSSFEKLIEKCLRKYLFPNKDKSCVFIDMQTNKCLQH